MPADRNTNASIFGNAHENPKAKGKENFKKIEYSDKYGLNDLNKFFLSKTTNFPLLTDEETKEAFRKYREEGDLEARNLIVTSNMKLVIKIANKWVRQGGSLPDLVDEGVFGLYDAIEHFDYTKDIKFNTYCTNWIVQYVCKQYHQDSTPLSISSLKRSQIAKMVRFQKDFFAKENRQPTNEEIAEALGVSIKVVEANIKYGMYETLSLDYTYASGENKEEELSNIILTDSTEFEAITTNDLIEHMLVYIDEVLDEREKTIITLLYGIGTDEPKSLGYIAEIYGVSNERIRQLSKQAIGKLRDKFMKDERGN